MTFGPAVGNVGMYVAGEMLSSVPEDQRHLWPRWVPVGRMGVPEDQARIVLFLASDQSAFLTGQVLNTAGGTEAAGGWFRTDRGRGGWTNRPVDP